MSPARQLTAHVSIVERVAILKGGSPRGGDPFHKLVASWPGWRRVGHGSVGDTPVSIFSAPLWPASIAPLFSSGIKLTGDVAALLEISAQPKVVSSWLNTHNIWRSKLHGRRLKNHQVQAEYAIRAMHHTAILADEMGLGKTTTAIAASVDLGPVLVICPSSVKYNWRNEIWNTIRQDALVIDGSPASREKQFIELGKFRYWIINYDLLPYLDDGHAAQLRDAEYLICDESQYLKNRAAKRTKIVMGLSLSIPRRLLLSGTPILDTIEDIWSQIEICRPGTWTSYGNFASRHLIQTPVRIGGRKSFMKVSGTRNVEQLNAVINTMQIRRLKSEVLDLPPKIHTYPELEMDPVTKPVYQAMKRYAILELGKLDGGDSIFKPQASSAMEAALRCEQLAQGFVGGLSEAMLAKLAKKIYKHVEAIPGRPGELVFPKAAKLVWARESIDTIIAQGGRPIVMGRYNAPLLWLHNKYLGAGLIHGDVSSAERQEIIDLFQAGQIPVLFCQLLCAVGWNGTISNDVIFLGRDWSPARNAQAEDRTHRIGTTGTVNIQVPIVRGSIEMHIHRTLSRKANEAEAALKSLTISQLKEML